MIQEHMSKDNSLERGFPSHGNCLRALYIFGLLMCAGTAGFFNQFVLSPLSENISITPSACQVKFSARVLLGLSVGRASRLLCVRSMLETLFYTNSKMHVPKTFEHFTTNTHRISQIFCHRNIPNINVIYCPFNLSRIIPGT